MNRKLAGENIIKGSHCVRKLTEDAIHMDCGCDYGLIHEPTAGYRKCNFTDMVTCANGYVKNYIFGILDDKVESFCPQPCESLDYEIRHIMVSLCERSGYCGRTNDQNFKYRDSDESAVAAAKRRHNLSDDYKGSY